MTVNFISERHLRQVHSVITAVAKAERWSPWEALGWLAREAELGTPGLDLIREPTTNADTVRRLPPAESLARWRDMAKRAAANKVDRNDLPVAAMTWCMCEADIAVFARSESLSSACRRALLALVPDTSPVDVPEVRAAAAPSTAATIEPAPAAAHEWEELARIEARRIRKAAEANGWFPNLKKLGDEVAEVFNQKKYVGPNGHAMSGAHITRNALQGHGITKPADKLRSMRSTPGHRGK